MAFRANHNQQNSNHGNQNVSDENPVLYSYGIFSKQCHAKQEKKKTFELVLTVTYNFRLWTHNTTDHRPMADYSPVQSGIQHYLPWCEPCIAHTHVTYNQTKANNCKKNPANHQHQNSSHGNQNVSGENPVLYPHGYDKTKYIKKQMNSPKLRCQK